MLDAENEELLGIFFEEAQNLVDTLEENIMSLEDDPNNAGTIDEIFRAAHTLKGSSASVDMMELSEFTHVVEDVFDAIRGNGLGICRELVDLLLNSLDVVKSMLDARLNGSVYLEDVSELKGKLVGFLGKSDQRESMVSLGGASDDRFLLSSFDLHNIRESLGLGQKVLRVSINFNKDNPMATISGIQMFQALKDLSPILHTVPSYEQIIADEYLPRVDYYLIYSDIDNVEKKINISDVVSNYAIEELDIEGELGESEARERGVIKSNLVYGDEVQLSSVELLSLRDRIGDAKLFEVKLNFNRDNPMATISGMQMMQALESLGEVYKSIPDNVALLADKFFDVVVYYLISDTSTDSIARKINLEDVVVSFEIKEVNLENVKDLSLDAETDEASAKHFKKGAPLNVNLIRIDSKRIDSILNLVSEAVINKSAYNQINSDMASLLYSFNYFYDYQESFQRNFLVDLKVVFKDMGLELENAVETQIKNLMNHKIERTLHDMGELRDSFLKILQDSKFASGRLSRIITDLHESVLRTRMLPVSGIFLRFTRVVRDLSRKLGKVVELDTEGGDTEIDKSVIDDLVEPLMHCVRNSMDHGLETSEERLRKGKDRVGHILLRARNEGNIISIDIADDGRGIDPNIIRQKSIEKGIIKKDDKFLPDSDVLNLIFSPGFSTASQITDVSGRGVGLDVVKKSIEKLNGTILIDSKIDVGTTFKIKLPLTLVIVQGLLVKSGSELYVVPLNSVLETHRISEENVKLIENEHEVYNLREEIVSVLRLDRLFNIERYENLSEKFLIVINVDDKKAGIVVDLILGEEDFVVKPIKDKYASSPGIVGATTLGDGKVVLIIDVFKLFELRDRKE